MVFLQALRAQVLFVQLREGIKNIKRWGILRFQVGYRAFSGFFDQHSKAESLRNRLVGEALPYQGRFRKLRVEHQDLLSCLLSRAHRPQ